MSSPASATEHPRVAARACCGAALAAARSRSRRASCTAPPEVATLLPADTCVYIPSLPGLPLARTLDAIAAIRAAGPRPGAARVGAAHPQPRRVPRRSCKKAAAQHGVHRVLLIGGDEPRPKGPFADSLQMLEQGVLKECGVREFGVARLPGGPSAHSAQQRSTRALERKIDARARAGHRRLHGHPVLASRRSAWWNTARVSPARRPELPVYVGIAGPTDPAALLRYAQRCGVSVSLRALRTLGIGIAQLVTNTDPRDQLDRAGALQPAARAEQRGRRAHLQLRRCPARTAAWMRELL